MKGEHGMGVSEKEFLECSEVQEAVLCGVLPKKPEILIQKDRQQNKKMISWESE